MAPRVTLEEAAKIGGCSMADFVRVLTPLGFQFELENAAMPSGEKEEPAPPLPGSILPKEFSETEVDYFDVREIIASGGDPLKNIIQRYKKLDPGKVLCILNSFAPTPGENVRKGRCKISSPSR